MAAAAAQEQQGIRTIFTRLGENITRVEEAEEVTTHYLDVLDKIKAAGLQAQISVKPTQLGLDQDKALCLRNLQRLVDRASETGNFVWLDMESSPYVDPTLDLFRKIKERSPLVGVALQAYLYRTAADIESLLPIGPAIRLVKGAYPRAPRRRVPEEIRRRRELLHARVPPAVARRTEGGRAPPRRDARPRARRTAGRVRRRASRADIRVRIRDALRHPASAAAAAGQGRQAAARADRVRRVPGSRGTCAASPSVRPTSGSSSRTCSPASSRLFAR